MNESMILAAASILERQDYPPEMLLDFLWLLFARSVYAANVDSLVSLEQGKMGIKDDHGCSFTKYVRSCIPCEHRIYLPFMIHADETVQYLVFDG